MTAPAGPPAVPIAAVTGLLSAVRAIIPENPVSCPEAAAQAAEVVRCIAGSLLTRGLDEYALRGAAVLLRDMAAEPVPAGAS